MNFANRFTRSSSSVLALICTFLMLPVAVAVSLYYGRFWLSPTALSTTALGMIFIGFIVLPPIAVAQIKSQRIRIETALLGSYLMLWLGAWRPESRAIGIWIALLLLFVSTLSKRPLIRAAGLLFTIIAVGLASYERTYGVLDSAAVQAVMQTYSAESLAFIWQELNSSAIALLFLSVIFFVALCFYSNSSRVNQHYKWISLIGLTLILPLAGKDALEKAIVFRTAIRQLESERNLISNPTLEIITNENREPLDVILILGESMSKRHWHLYGSPVNTTPRIDLMKDDIVRFTDAVSGHSHTVPAVSAMMYREVATGNSADFGLNERVSIIDVLKRANIDTEWISAQAPYGKWAAPISNLARSSYRRVFTNQNGDGNHLFEKVGDSVDDRATRETLNALTRDHESQSRLIVQHHFAAHWPYCSHKNNSFSLPTWSKDEAWFGNAANRSNELQCYFEAIGLVDKLIADVAIAAEELKRPIILIYVPDHGEDPEGGTGHASSLHSAPHVEVPFIIRFNSAAAKAFPEKLDSLRRNSQSPFMNTWTYELLLDLFGIEVKDLKLEAPAISSTPYAPPPRVIFKQDFPLNYDARLPGDRKDSIEWSRLNLREIKDRGIWKTSIYAHRVNSIAKALDVKDFFDGIEFDVNFDDPANDFFVYHQPAKNVGLKLTELLHAVADQPKLKLWLDFKNISDSNIQNSLDRLKLLDDRWAIKHRAILEIPASSVTPMTKLLVDSGWKTSYYIPYEFARCKNNSPVTALPTCQQQASHIISQANLMGASYLSYDVTVSKEVNQWVVPSMGGLQLLSWNLSIDSSHVDFPTQVERMGKLSGFIVSFKSKYDR